MTTKFYRAVALFALVSFLTLGVNAQTQVFKKNDIDLNVGLGFGNPWINPGYSTLIPSINASVDYGLRDDWGPGVFGVGAYVGTAFYQYVYAGDYGTRYTSFLLAGRATYHYTFVENLDTYGGAVLGARFTSDRAYGTWPGGNPSPSRDVDAVHELFVGAKYYFTGSFAAFVELSTGSSIPIFTVGACFKF